MPKTKKYIPLERLTKTTICCGHGDNREGLQLVEPTSADIVTLPDMEHYRRRSTDEKPDGPQDIVMFEIDDGQILFGSRLDYNDGNTHWTSEDGEYYDDAAINWWAYIYIPKTPKNL